AAGIFTGSFVVEKVFNIPGVGFHFVTSALNRDHPMILACVMLYSGLLLVMNLLVDVGYAWLDPRIRYD
ncbi:MAG TPA: ABC transporter permease subunit, partial [Phycisphaerae bacterium]|nr:ABC transporter permease subunit [Phycisphaerae bacterium]